LKQRVKGFLPCDASNVTYVTEKPSWAMLESDWKTMVSVSLVLVTCSQFYQQITNSFLDYFFLQRITNTNCKHIKAAHEIMVKLTPVVNFNNILWAVFEPISFPQKITNTNCKHRKAAKTLSCTKLLEKCWYNFHLRRGLCSTKSEKKIMQSV